MAVDNARRDYDSRGAGSGREFIRYSAGASVWHHKKDFSPARSARLHRSFRWVRDCAYGGFPFRSRMKPPPNHCNQAPPGFALMFVVAHVPGAPDAECCAMK